jgi:hypothetical protein
MVMTNTICLPQKEVYINIRISLLKTNYKATILLLLSENHVLNELYQQIFDKLTSNILSPVLRVPFLPAGLSSKTCFINIPEMMLSC